MKNSATFQVTTSGDRAIVIFRTFDAPRGLVWDTMTKPALLKRWLTGPPGWSLEVCEVDLKVGGAYRYEWHNANGSKMGMGGVHREIICPERLVCTQMFDEDWTGGEAVGTLVLTEKGGRTFLTNTILYATPAIREAVLKTPMEQGMAVGYDKLEEMLESMPAT